LSGKDLEVVILFLSKMDRPRQRRANFNRKTQVLESETGAPAEFLWAAWVREAVASREAWREERRMIRQDHIPFKVLHCYIIRLAGDNRWQKARYGFYYIWSTWHIMRARWTVELADEFEPEFDALHDDVREQIYALWLVLEVFGPQLGRPRADTLKGSTYANMKELRFSAADGEWRVAFAFDPRRRAILLVAGDKSGGSERRFYRDLIRKADERFNAHLDRLKKERK